MYKTQFPDHITPSMTPAEEKEFEQNRSEPHKGKDIEPPSDLAKIFASVFVPGLGQAMQKRFWPAFALFALFGISIFLFYLDGFWAFAFHVPLLLYASLDVALHVNPGPNIRNESIMLLGVFGPLLSVLMLALLLSPAVIAAREAARRMQCTCVFKLLVLAMHDYHDVHKSLPPAYTVDANGKPLHSWRVLILPYIEQKELYDKIRLDEPWDSEHNRQFHNVYVSERFTCPTAPTANPLFKKFPNLRKNGDCYASVIIGEETAFPGSKAVSFDDIHDSFGDTILVVERLTPICWMDPNHEILSETAILGVNQDPNGLGSFHNAKVRCATVLADGSVEYLPDDFPPELIKAMLTISGKENIDDWRDHLKR